MYNTYHALARIACNLNKGHELEDIVYTSVSLIAAHAQAGCDPGDRREFATV